MRQVKINFIQREKIAKEYVDGDSIPKLAERYGVATSTINNILNQAGIEKRGYKKFDGELADKLRKEYEAGATTTALAEKYKMHRPAVCNYIREAGGKIRPRGPLKKMA